MILVENKYEIQHLGDNMTDDELFEFCVANKTLHIERDKHLNIIIMPPTSGFSGYCENEANGEIRNWRKKTKSGYSFSSSTGYLLPNGAMRSPDSSWISSERWATIPESAKSKFLPIVPDFIIEIRSPTDTLKGLKEKMLEWIENGVKLAWLIDLQNQQTYIYRIDGSIEIVKGFDKKLSGEMVMEGFEFDLELLKFESF